MYIYIQTKKSIENNTPSPDRGRGHKSIFKVHSVRLSARGQSEAMSIDNASQTTGTKLIILDSCDVGLLSVMYEK